MRLAKLQDPRLIYKNQLYFYTLAMNTPKMKRIPFIIASKRILRNKFNKRNSRLIQ